MPFIPDYKPPRGLGESGTWVCPECGKRTRVSPWVRPLTLRPWKPWHDYEVYC